MKTVNIKVSFVYGWGSLRKVKVFVDGILYDKILARGEHVLEIPEDTTEITFKLGMIYPYKTSVFLTSDDKANKEIFIGLHLHHRSLLLSFYDSLKTDYLRSLKLSENKYLTFHQDIYKQEYVILKDGKASVLNVLISLLILVFSVIQQDNEFSPLAFLIGLSSTISSLVYFSERKIEKTTYKTRTISTLLAFILAALFLENSFHFLNWIILMFTGLLFSFFIEDLKNKEHYNLTKEV